MKNIENILIQSLEQVVDEFGKDELAFLALTTKIELPLRDRLAYVLYKKLKAHKIKFICKPIYSNDKTVKLTFCRAPE